jgi:cytochrome c oxidase subunit II
MPTSGDALAGAELFQTTCSNCHLARGINDEQHADALEQNDGRALTVPGSAPDLTHFASRGAFAGAMFNLWVTENPDGVVQWDEIGGELNREELEAWLRDPPGQKPMDAVLDSPDSRGMPNYNLSEDQIDLLIAFLETLD